MGFVVVSKDGEVVYKPKYVDLVIIKDDETLKIYDWETVIDKRGTMPEDIKRELEAREAKFFINIALEEAEKFIKRLNMQLEEVLGGK
ncbi:MAG: hypothetical protein ACTSPL_04180 [Candidatus Odinarchaeia archaeon]